MRPLPALMTTHMMINQIKNLPHLLATMDGSASDPALENSTTVTAALTQADIDAEYIRSLDRQFIKHKFEADQLRLSPRRARK